MNRHPIADHPQTAADFDNTWHSELAELINLSFRFEVVVRRQEYHVDKNNHILIYLIYSHLIYLVWTAGL